MEASTSLEEKSWAWRWQHSRLLRAACHGIWAAAVMILPITSLPLIVQLTGASAVAAPAPLLFGLLIVVWALPYILLKGKIPAEAGPFLVFLLFVLLSWLASFFIGVPPFRGRTVLSEGLEAFITLALAAATYLAAASWLSTGREKILFTLRWLNWSGIIMIAWAGIQAIYILYFDSDYPSRMYQFQEIFSSRRFPLFSDRTTGFAYEPSWYAHQLNMIYLPVWLAATVTRFTVHRFKIWRFSVENLLLVFGMVTLYLSFSRVGWGSFLLVVAWLALMANFHLAGRIYRSMLAHPRIRAVVPQRSVRARIFKGGVIFFLLLLFLLFYVGMGVLLVYIGIQIDPRMERIANRDLLNAQSFYHLTNSLEFAERVLYWATGWEIFNDHPILGVGLGNAGFYFNQKMPAFGWALTEVKTLFWHQSFIPNTKSMWVRLLTETGLVGFSIFVGWYYLMWRSGQAFSRFKDPVLRLSVLAGQLALVAFLTEGFSVDSFALPYFWFTAGLLSAGAALGRRDLLADVSSGASSPDLLDG